MVQVQVEGEEKGRPLLFETDHDIEQELGLELSDILLQPTEGTAQMVVANNSGFTKINVYMRVQQWGRRFLQM